MRTIIGINRARAVLLVTLAACALGRGASATPGVHTVFGTATNGTDTIIVNASEPGSGTVILNGQLLEVSCVEAYPFGPDFHDVFILAGSPGGAPHAIHITDEAFGVDQFGVGPATGGPCNAAVYYNTAVGVINTTP